MLNKQIFTRSPKNPILKPIKSHSWESRKVYNPGVIFHNNRYHLYYRAMGKKWFSSIGYGVSADGESFRRNMKPLLTVENDSEARGLEDPRLVKIGHTFYMAYAAYDGISPCLSLATSKDLKRWTKRGAAFRDWQFAMAGGLSAKKRNGHWIKKTQSGEWSKSGGVFPEKIGGKFRMLFGEYRIWLAVSNNGLKWRGGKQPFLAPRPDNYFDNMFVEMGPPPIKTDKGWLVLYHGVDENIVYRLGYLLLDLENPNKIIYRSKKPIFEPREKYELSGMVDILPGGFKGMQKMTKPELTRFLKEAEKTGFMPAVTFCCGAVLKDDILRIYYGASDSVICTATARLEDVLTAA